MIMMVVERCSHLVNVDDDDDDDDNDYDDCCRATCQCLQYSQKGQT